MGGYVVAMGSFDAAALHFANTTLVEAVSSHPGAHAWRATLSGSAELETRLLP